MLFKEMERFLKRILKKKIGKYFSDLKKNITFAPLYV